MSQNNVEMVAIHARIRRNASKLTGPRQAILRVLCYQVRPLTNKEIYEAMTPGNCNLATVYRSVHMLERLGLVKRFQIGRGATRYALIGESPNGHQHHLVCIRCQELVAIGECIVHELEERVAARSKFRSVTHRLEFFGVCPSCQ